MAIKPTQNIYTPGDTPLGSFHEELDQERSLLDAAFKTVEDALAAGGGGGGGVVAFADMLKTLDLSTPTPSLIDPPEALKLSTFSNPGIAASIMEEACGYGNFVGVNRSAQVVNMELIIFTYSPAPEDIDVEYSIYLPELGVANHEIITGSVQGEAGVYEMKRITEQATLTPTQRMLLTAVNGMLMWQLRNVGVDCVISKLAIS